MADVGWGAEPAPGELGCFFCDHRFTKSFVLAGCVDPAGFDDVNVDAVSD